jgi:L-alanine-DL-glutamate epimerase-like enolase superfamily enzyme
MQYNRGRLAVPSGPGLGFEIDRDKLRQLRFEKAE